MNIIDILLVAVLVLAAWGGWQRGFILSSIGLATWLGSLAAGFVADGIFAGFYQRWFPSISIWALPLGFVTGVLLARLLLSLIFNRIIAATSPQLHETTTNHALGVLPGIVSGVVYDTILAALLVSLPIANSISDKIQKSRLAGGLANNVEWLNERLAPIFNPAVQRTLSKLTVEPGSDEAGPGGKNATTGK
jgi:uncharacterized membrane protein required for colicin V production